MKVSACPFITLPLLDMLEEKFSYMHHDRSTCTLLAAQWKQLHMLKFLVNRGGNIYNINSEGYTVLHLAAETKRSDFFHEVLCIIKERCNKVPTFLASSNADYQEDKKCGNAPQNITNFFNLPINHSRETLLHFVLRFLENLSVVTLELLFACGKQSEGESKNVCVNVNAVDSNGDNALHHALSGKQSLEIVKYLVSQGVDFHLKNSSGRNMVCECVIMGLLDHLKYFIELGCNVNELDMEGNNALHLAFKYSDQTLSTTQLSDIIMFLINAGLNTGQKNLDGMTAYDLATKKELPFCILCLLQVEREPKLGMPLQQFIKQNLNELIRYTTVSPILLDKCVKENILSEYDVQTLRILINKQSDASNRFWNYIKISSDCLDKLINIFREERQMKIVNILNKALHDNDSEQEDNFMEHLKPLDVQGTIYKIDPSNIGQLTAVTIKTPLLLDKCLQEKILSEYEVEVLNLSINTQQDFASQFWKYMQTRPNCLDKLINIFREENQYRVVEILEKGERDNGSNESYNFIKNLKPLEVKVVRPNEVQTFEKDVKYKLDPDIIGGALLINATLFNNTAKNRSDAEKDSEYMEKLWGQLGYKVYSYKGNISTQNLLDVRIPNFLNQFKKNSSLQSCVVFIGSHEENGKLQMSDEREVDLYDDLISKFVDCHELKDKSKIFVFPACQNITGKSISQVNLSDTKDLILCFPTVPDDTANQRKCWGSWFIYTLTDVFMHNAYKLEIREMLRKVQKTMLEKFLHEEAFDKFPYWIDFNGLQPLYFNVAPENA